MSTQGRRIAYFVLSSWLAWVPSRARAQTPADPSPSGAAPAPSSAAPPTPVDASPGTSGHTGETPGAAQPAPSPPLSPFTGLPEPPPAPPTVAAPAVTAPPFAPPPSLPYPPPVLLPAPTPQARPADEREQRPRERDAHVDRVLIMPTAETHPAGTFYLSSYEIVIGQLGYALSDSTQISLTATPPLGDGDQRVIPADISVKSVFFRAPGVSAAVIGSASGILGLPEFSGFLGRAGGAVTLCGSVPHCGLSVSVASTVALAGPASVWFSGAGVTWRVGRLVSLLGELDTAVPLGEVVGQANGVLGGAGVRLSGARWGIDLGVVAAGKAHEKAGGVPWLVGTYRVLP